MKKTSILCFGLMIAGMLMFYSSVAQSGISSDSEILNSVQFSEQLKIFPNPSNGQFQLTFEYAGQEKIVAKVFDITGKLLKDISKDLVFTDSIASVDVDLQSPPTGIYFLRIEVGRDTYAKKIIIR